MTLDAKGAAQIAAEYYTELSNEPAKLTIEEIEREGNFWLITVPPIYSSALLRLSLHGPAAARKTMLNAILRA